MKMSCGREDIEISEGIVKLFEEWSEDSDYTEEEQEEALWSFYLDKLIECDGKLVDKELAEFLALINANDIPSEGGYPKYGEANFEIAGRKFTAISFFWDSLEKSDEPHVMVYEMT